MRYCFWGLTFCLIFSGVCFAASVDELMKNMSSPNVEYKLDKDIISSIPLKKPVDISKIKIENIGKATDNKKDKTKKTEKTEKTENVMMPVIKSKAEKAENTSEKGKIDSKAFVTTSEEIKKVTEVKTGKGTGEIKGTGGSQNQQPVGVGPRAGTITDKGGAQNQQPVGVGPRAYPIKETAVKEVIEKNTEPDEVDELEGDEELDEEGDDDEEDEMSPDEIKKLIDANTKLIVAEFKKTKVNAQNLRRYADEIVVHDPMNAHAHYALAYSFYHAKKPNISRAQSSIAIAMRSKNPPEGASSLAFSIKLKSWQNIFVLLIGGVVLVVFVISRKKVKPKKQLQADEES